MTAGRAGGRKKLEPDPRVRSRDPVRRGESCPGGRRPGALSIAGCSAGRELSTRAFYRHFDSKDQLVSALFLEMARVEMRAASAADGRRRPTRCVRWRRGSTGAWTWPSTSEIRSDLRQMSLEAQSQMFAAPEFVAPAYARDPAPARRTTRHGERDLGLFTDIDPDSDALSIQGVVWANVERHGRRRDADLRELRQRVAALLPARPGGRARNDRRCARRIAEPLRHKTEL